MYHYNNIVRVISLQQCPAILLAFNHLLLIWSATRPFHCFVYWYPWYIYIYICIYIYIYIYIAIQYAILARYLSIYLYIPYRALSPRLNLIYIVLSSVSSLLPVLPLTSGPCYHYYSPFDGCYVWCMGACVDPPHSGWSSVVSGGCHEGYCPSSLPPERWEHNGWLL